MAGGPTSAAISTLQRDINRLLDTPELERGSWGIFVKSLAHDDALYSLNARKLLMPASNMKLATLAAAAERLGWQYTYDTRLVAFGSIRDGRLDGDLVVVGSGDPSLDNWDGAAARLFRTWAEQLKAAGIRSIAGRIIGDDRAFAGEPFGVGWAWDDLNRSFATGVGALQFNQNTAQLVVTPAPLAGGPATVRLRPPTSGLIVQGAVMTTAPERRPAISVRRLPGSSTLDVRGSVQAGTPPAVVNVSVPNPTIYFVTELRDALITSGVGVTGDVSDVDDITNVPAGEGTLIATYRSPPLVDLATTMMKNSQNLYAETLLRTLGGRPAAFAPAREVAESVLRAWGIAANGVIIADGSGLSPNNLITPEAIATILTHVDRDPRMRDAFERTLPIAGVDGTLAQRMKGSAAERNARAKTGSVSNVRGISGYVAGADGEPLVFSIIANNFGIGADAIEKLEDAIVIRLARFSRH